MHAPLYVASAGLALALSLLAAPPAAAARSGAAQAPPAMFGYNDDFNFFELHGRNDPEDLLGRLGAPPLAGLPGLLPGSSEPVPAEPESIERVALGAELIDRARQGGARLIRYPVPWVRVESERGSYDFSVDDQTYELTLEAGLKPVIILFTSPCWAHPSIPCEAPFRAVRPDGNFRADFARYARAAIERYPEAVAFEIWNESNFKAFWGPQPSPRSYVKMLEAVATEVADIPHPPLLFNGLIPKPRWRNYLNRAYRMLGAGRYAQATASHPYAGSRGPRVVRRMIGETKRILGRAKAPPDVWITEVGWSTNPEAEAVVSPAQQARRMARVEQVVASTGVRALLVHRLRDIDHPDPWEAGLGALRIDDTPKPLFCQLGVRHAAARPAGC